MILVPILARARLRAPPGMQGGDFPRLCLAPESPGLAAPWRDDFYDEHPTIQPRDLIPLSDVLVSRDAKYLRWLEFGVEQLADLARQASWA